MEDIEELCSEKAVSLFVGQMFDAGFVFLMIHCSNSRNRGPAECHQMQFRAEEGEEQLVADPGGLDPDPAHEKHRIRTNKIHT